jgi:cytochrome b6-f complex iron-sulfur subunit
MSVRHVPGGDLRRREFLGVCASVAALPMFAACASLRVRPVPVANGRVELPLLQYPELGEVGGAVQILPTGEEHPLIVLVGNDRSHTVLSSQCTHRGCTVEAQGERIVCPCHGSTYDRGGAVLKGPAQRSLRRYQAEVKDGVLVIQLDR